LEAILKKYLLLVVCLVAPGFALAQSGDLSGSVKDSSGGVIAKAAVRVENEDTHAIRTALSGADGLYSVPFLLPAQYKITVELSGFEQSVMPGVVIEAGESVRIDVVLRPGSNTEVVTVESSTPMIDTQTATVSTEIDRNFVENLPMNGRSFQTIIQITPGVVVTYTGGDGRGDGGQFSVNGQRTVSNYYTIDGVSANFSIGGYQSADSRGAGGGPATSSMGGMNNLVSVDALQEFQIQTSTFAPEFGRSPGAQVQIVTRSGSNQFHGTAFEYFRNDVLDANNWFANAGNLPRPATRVNDFGGVFGGPIVKNKTFFFLSYEGQRLRVPSSNEVTVPSAAARAAAAANPIQAFEVPILNAFPTQDPGAPDLPNGTAVLHAAWSDPSNLDAGSVRVDHVFNDHFSLFGRYDIAPSDLGARGANNCCALSVVQKAVFRTQTFTVGTTWVVSANTGNEFRINYSTNSQYRHNVLDDFHGAVVPTDISTYLPSPYTPETGNFTFIIGELSNETLPYGTVGNNANRQWNITDNLSVKKNNHSLKFGVDYRRLSPLETQKGFYLQQTSLDSPLTSAVTDGSAAVSVNNQLPATLLFRNLGLYAQDTWHINSRLTATYGLRWDLDLSPQAIDGPPLPSVINFYDPATIALAPAGTPVYKTKYTNFGPRVGLAYQLRQAPGRETVLRGGFGVFYDLASLDAADGYGGFQYPYGSSKSVCCSAGQLPAFPLSTADATPAPIAPFNFVGGIQVAIDPNLKTPLIYQWNVTLEQALGQGQKLSVAYIGSADRHLPITSDVFAPDYSAVLQQVYGLATSSYNALQVQYQRRLAHGFQAMASYTFAHAIDDASDTQIDNYLSNGFVFGPGVQLTSASSDFDVRHTFTGALTYNIPGPKNNKLLTSLLGGWSTDNNIIVRSGLPVDIADGSIVPIIGPTLLFVRPDLVPGVPLYLHGSQYPGGTAINPAAFTDPPLDSNGFPLRQGNVPRNYARGLGASQWDFVIRRTFNLHESTNLQFRAEFYNILNHPNFSGYDNYTGDALFGQATEMLSQQLGAGNKGTGALNSIFQVGGPRSIQLALKLNF
jgi:Carboxypeptidase regulatory-like domain/TonB dependent receptor